LTGLQIPPVIIAASWLKKENFSLKRNNYYFLGVFGGRAGIVYFGSGAPPPLYFTLPGFGVWFGLGWLVFLFYYFWNG